MSALNINEMHDLCLICLTKTSNLLQLDSSLLEKKNTKISLLTSLEKVMSWKLKIQQNYPSKICLMCKSLLKVAYDLHVSFYKSQKKLTDLFKETETKIQKSPVDLLSGDYKFDINNLIIVKNEPLREESFSGFSKNLSEVSVSKPLRKIAPKPPVINNNVKISEVHKNKSPNNKIETTVSGAFENKRITPKKLIIYTEKIWKKGRNKTQNNKSETAFCNQEMKTEDSSDLEKNVAPNAVQNIKTIVLYPKDLNSKPKRAKIPTVCEICGYVSVNQTRARNHRIKHAEKSFECQHCHKKFGYKCNLDIHLKRHRGFASYLCPICGKDFFYSSALAYHMKTHKNERNYVCEYCSKKFFMMSTLKRHVRIHTDDRPFACKFCKKGFRSNQEKQKHEMLHTGEKPFKCRFCEKTFISSSKRLVHHLCHSGPHECDFCRKTFIELEFLKRHIRDKHKDLKVDVNIDEVKV